MQVSFLEGCILGFYANTWKCVCVICDIPSPVHTILRWCSRKESACNAGDSGSIPELGRPPGVGIGNPLQYSCLDNSRGRGAWWAIVHGVTKSLTWLSPHTHTHTHTHTHRHSTAYNQSFRHTRWLAGISVSLCWLLKSGKCLIFTSVVLFGPRKWARM